MTVAIASPSADLPAAAAPVAAAAAPAVSVVVTTYDHAHFLADALASVERQTCRDFETVVVDDGSHDDPAAVVAGFPGVRLIRQDNAGLAAARNTGLRHSRGRHVVFLDADDRLLPDALATGLRHFRVHPGCAFVSGGHRRIAADGTPLGEPVAERPAHGAYASLLRGNYIGMHAAVMYRRDVLLQAGGFDPGLRACEDYDLYLRLARSHEVRCHDGIVAEYRWHGANMSRDVAGMLAHVLAVLRRQWPFVRHDPVLRRRFREGERIWRDYYARLFLQGLRTGPATAGLGGAVRLLRLAPGAVLGLAARHAVRRAAARLPQAVAGRLAPRQGRPVPVGRVRFGDLRRTRPLSRVFGSDRGQPIDRHYIEGFLDRHRSDVRGRVLEIGDDAYTRQFGGAAVARSDILHVAPDNPRATYVGDLSDAPQLPSGAFDCIVLTQTLHLIYDVRAAVATIHRILAPGGVALVTVPGISQIEDGEWGGGWLWSFTAASLRRRFVGSFPAEAVDVESHGNVLAAVAFLHGVAYEEMAPAEIDRHDPLYPVIVALRAVKPPPAPS